MPGRFTVPQFIDAEDKIMGPLSVRQFIILLVMVLLMFISWKLADLVLAGLLIAFWGGLGLVLAFVKINGQMFHMFLLSFLRTAKKPKLRIWYKDYTKEELTYYSQTMPEHIEEKKPQKKLRRSRLGELSLVVNTGGAYNPEQYK